MRLTDYVVLCAKKAWIRQMPGDTGSDVWTGMVFTVIPLHRQRKRDYQTDVIRCPLQKIQTTDF